MIESIEREEMVPQEMTPIPERIRYENAPSKAIQDQTNRELFDGLKMIQKHIHDIDTILSILNKKLI